MTENVPENLYYTKTHEWIRIDNGVAVIGITDYAVEQMNKEIVNIDLPEVGTEFKQGDSFGIIDSVKAAFDLYAPVSGEIVDVNDSLAGEPTIAADSPYDQGWMLKVKMNNEEEIHSLLKAEDYKKLIESSA